MSRKAAIDLKPDQDGGLVAEILIHDRKLIGKKAKFSIEHNVKVLDSRPVSDSKVLMSHEFKTQGNKEIIKIPAKILKSKGFFPYSGEKIKIKCHARLQIDDKLIRKDTTIWQKLPVDVLKKPLIDNDTKELIDPKDIFQFFKNLMAIPAHNKVFTLGLLVIGLILIVVNMLIGFHDQMSPDYATWLYDHHGSDGDSESPLLKALMGCGGIGVAIWFAMRKQLRKYMTFRFKKIPQRVDRDTVVMVSDLVEGIARVDLREVTLRVVACNMEKGQYTRGSGTNTRTVSFSEPTRGVLLYSRTIDLIPKKQPVESYFNEEFPFKPMFKALYPPNMVSSTHGLQVYWEVQFIHNEFVDHELEGDINIFKEEDFHNS
jgi:hypothetical protein